MLTGESGLPESPMAKNAAPAVPRTESTMYQELIFTRSSLSTISFMMPSFAGLSTARKMP